MNTGRIRLVGLFFTAVVLAGCSFGTMQTAKTLGMDKLGITVGGNLVPAEGTSEDGFLPEIGFRYGVTDTLDVGAKLFGLGFILDGKFGLLQSPETGPSVALLGGVGYSWLNKASLITAEIGAVGSIELGGLAPYFSVKYRNFSFGGSSDDLLGDFIGEFAIVSFGVQLFSRSKFSIFVEADRFEAIKLFESDVSGVTRWLYSFGIALKV